MFPLGPARNPVPLRSGARPQAAYLVTVRRFQLVGNTNGEAVSLNVIPIRFTIHSILVFQKP
jgi:hypothetical protein